MTPSIDERQPAALFRPVSVGRVHSFEFCRQHHRKETWVSFIVEPREAGADWQHRLFVGRTSACVPEQAG